MADSVQTLIKQQAPWLETAGQANLAGANELIQNNPNYTPYGGQRVAGLGQDTIDAIDLTRSGIGSYQPMLNQANNVAHNVPYNYNRQAGRAISLFDQGARYNPASVSPGGQYYNPFQQGVIDTTMAEMNRQGEIQQNRLDAQAAKAGAYGGSRHGLAEAEMYRNQSIAQGNELARLNAAGYTSAQQAQQQHAKLQQQSGLGIGQLAQSGAKVGLSAAQTQSNLGLLGQQLNQADANALSGAGALQQKTYQDQLDFDYGQWQKQQTQPYQNLMFVNDIIKGVPSSQSRMTAATVPQSSSLSQGIGALGQYATMGKQFGWWGNSNG